MTRNILLAALITGAFCADLCTGIDLLTDMRCGADRSITVSFASGFLGSLFASFVLGKRR